MVTKQSRRGATPPPTESVVIEEVDIDKVDPSKMEYDEWLAGLDEWEKEGHDYEDLSLERSQWEALLRRRAARLERERAAAKEKLRLEQRQADIKSLTPPPCGIVADAKTVSDAEAALSETKLKSYEAWNCKFHRLPENVREAWTVYHDDRGDDEFPEFFLRPRTPSPDDFPADLAEIRSGLADSEYEKFQRYSMAVFQQIESLESNLERALSPPAGARPLLKGWSLNEIDENDGSVWPVPGLVPHGLTFVYGLPKSGKSLWMQKLSACIAGGVAFDDIKELEHGRVLYITRDIGASRQEVKKRVMKILPHLNLSAGALDGKLILTDDPFFLDNPASVDKLLEHNPGRFVLVAIDSLFRCVNGSLTQDVVASAAVEGIDRISRATGAAVVAVHHEPRGGEHLFGSVMLDAAYDAQIHVERGKDRNSVIVTVQELKNAPIPDKPFRYEIEEEYLAPLAGASGAPTITPKPAASRHQDMLALLPNRWISRKEGRKLVEPLLTGTEEARRKQWQRAVAAMQAGGEIEVGTNRMRKK